jgi:hypothetical protein
MWIKRVNDCSRGQFQAEAAKFSRKTRGCRAAMRSNASAGPSGLRRPYVQDLGPDKGVFLRVGSTNRRADPVLITELRRYTLHQTFDEQPLPELSYEAIDFRAASEPFASVRKLRRRDLETLNVTTRQQGRLVPTVGPMRLKSVRSWERPARGYRFGGKRNSVRRRAGSQRTTAGV